MGPSGWKAVKLDEVLTATHGGGTPTRSTKAYWDGSIPWATVKDLGPRVLTKTLENITERGLHNSSSRLVPRNSVVMATRMNVGAVFRPGVALAINQDLRALVPGRELLSEYLFYLLQMNYRALNRLATGTTVKGLRTNVLLSLSLQLPPLPEQRRIAAILSSVDETIEKTQAVIDQVQTVKRSLMHELLTRGIPGRHRRVKLTKLGELPKEWETLPIDALCNVVRGSTPRPARDPKYFNGNYVPWITVGEVTKGCRSRIDLNGRA